MIKKTIIPLQVLEIEGDGCHLMIKAVVNGKATALLVDTGASKTVFDKNRMEKFVDIKDFKKGNKLSTGLGTRNMQTHSVILKQLKIGTLSISHFETVLLDLTHVNMSYEELDLPAIDGVLGSDLMLQYNAVLDYKSKKLKLFWKSPTKPIRKKKRKKG